ncbi:MAG: hypothetical protein EOP49_53695 [Sphingobacteriales bacterium]|nr:MAG: hypothetical protein EOP49_53695 [Sphingobacteriales bacterium]
MAGVGNVANRETRETTDEERTCAIRLGEEYTDTDSVEINVPAGYTVESLPRPVKLSTPFGTYECSTTFTDNKVRFTRVRCAYSGTFAATAWPQLQEFLLAVYKSDHSQLVLVKQ